MKLYPFTSLTVLYNNFYDTLWVILVFFTNTFGELCKVKKKHIPTILVMLLRQLMNFGFYVGLKAVFTNFKIRDKTDDPNVCVFVFFSQPFRFLSFQCGPKSGRYFPK